MHTQDSNTITACAHTGQQHDYSMCTHRTATRLQHVHTQDSNTITACAHTGQQHDEHYIQHVHTQDSNKMNTIIQHVHTQDSNTMTACAHTLLNACQPPATLLNAWDNIILHGTRGQLHYSMHGTTLFCMEQGASYTTQCMGQHYSAWNKGPATLLNAWDNIILHGTRGQLHYSMHGTTLFCMEQGASYTTQCMGQHYSAWNKGPATLLNAWDNIILHKTRGQLHYYVWSNPQLHTSLLPLYKWCCKSHPLLLDSIL